MTDSSHPSLSPPPPGSAEDIAWYVNELGKQFDRMYLAMQTMTAEMQRSNALTAELNEHCTAMVEALWDARGQSARLEKERDWWRGRAEGYATQLGPNRDTPVDRLPPDEDDPLPGSTD